jgi:protein involved in polysaccharide export with SLBB domain
VLVPPVLRQFEDGVELLGNVKRPGAYQWFDGIRLTDVIANVGLLEPQSDINYVLIRRENATTKRISAVSVNLAVALANPSSKENIFLLRRDQIRVFDLTDDRSVDVEALLGELSLQSSPGRPVERMIISGSVRAPGEFPYEQGMTAGDLVRAAGGFVESAYTFKAELTRRVVTDSGLSSKVILVDIGLAVDGDPLADIALEPSDSLLVKRKENWRSEGHINLSGEVRFPGRYSFRAGESLSSVLERAGGLTEQAFAGGSIFLRRSLQEREQKQIQELRERIQGDLAALALQSARSIEGGAIAEATGAGAALLSSLNAADATGRLVIDLERVLAGSGRENYQVFLKRGDRLLVPDRTQAVTVIGEVQFPTSHLFEKSLSRNDYIQRSGGIAPNGASKEVYIVKANGRVVATGSRWFRGSDKVEAGDTIVVPLDITRDLRLKAWASATTIIYNTAIAVAAINGLSN